MRGKLVRIVLWMFAAQIAAWIVGQIISKKMTRGDEGSDDFQIAAICGGKQFHSHAMHLKSGTVIASMGGIDLDLSNATLDPAGAELDLKATMGGVQVTVPEDWAVEVDEKSALGGFEVNVTPPEALPENAPRLLIHAVNRMGGGLVTTKAA
jgi:predicted membrane protein